jgi:hypothetical protein
MRIPLASRIRFKYAVIFATVLFLAQQVEGTNTIFSALLAVYILISTVAFNLAGGFVFPSGWFIFFNATLTCIVGLAYKVLLNEPGESHLKAPIVTMLAYCLGMTMFLGAVALTRKLIPKGGFLADWCTGEDMKKAALGAFLIGVVFQLLSYSAQENGSFLAALRQINYFLQMSILLGTFYQVKKSHGEKSSNWIVWSAGIFLFVTGGILGFSKYGALVSGVTWLSAAIAAGHDFTRKQLLTILGAAVFFQTIMVPYSQVARNLRGDEGTVSSDIKVVMTVLPKIGELRSEYLKDQKEYDVEGNSPHLYDQAQGFFDRLAMLPPDDALIAYTTDGNEEGLLPTYFSIINVIPHFLWKDKPFYYIGNLYAHEIGMIGQDDDTTGISFSPTADAFHQASWFGVVLLDPSILFVMFMVIDFLGGDIRRSPWGLLFCVTEAHAANEGMLGGQIYMATYIAFGVVVMATLARYVLPVVSGVISNTDRTRVRKTTDFKPVLKPQSPSIASPAHPGSRNA